MDKSKFKYRLKGGNNLKTFLKTAFIRKISNIYHLQAFHSDCNTKHTCSALNQRYFL